MLVGGLQTRLGREGRARVGHGEDSAFLLLWELTECFKQKRDFI